MPHWVLAADGSWRTVDTTLHTNVDGSVSPVASPNPVTLSGGGDSVLAKQVSNRQELVWSWPAGTLPKPRLAGSTATYTDALPGVDLVVRVDEYGFSEVLVVKSAAAAASPALSQIAFGLSGNGLSEAGLAGTATSIAAAVNENFSVGEAYMWDSTPPTTGMEPSAPAQAVQDATVSDAGGPGVGARQSLVPSRMDGRTFVLVPDAAMLTSPATKFPVFIDPKSSAPVRSYWTMINSGHTSQSYWSYDRADHAKVGNAGDGTNMYRSLFQFSTSSWKGKHVTAAEFHANLLYSWSCSNTSTEIHVSSAATIGSSTTWSSNSSTWGSSLDTASNQNCAQASGVDTEWSSSALTGGIDAKATASTVVIGLRAADESSGAAGWKKFDETSGSGGAQLSVTYNTAPTTSNLVLDGTACKTSSASPALLSTLGTPAHNPVPKVTVKDAEGDKSTVTFTYPKAGGGTTTTAMTNVTSGSSPQLSAGIPAANIPSGSTVYSWKVTVDDGTESSTSVTCYFKIDNTIPVAPVVTSADNRYPDNGETHDGVGKPGLFTITGTAGITKYVWGPGTGDPSNTVTTTNGAPITVSYTPTNEGGNSIQVIGYNAVGTSSAIGGLSFNVAAPDAPAGRWALNGDGADAGTGGHALTGTNVGWLADGKDVGSSVATFNGASPVAAAAPAAAVTTSSFAVSAWVRPHSVLATNDTVVVSQDGSDAAGFHLGTSSVSGAAHWSFAMKDTSAQTSTTRVAYSSAAITAADLNRWTLLVGVYDLSAQQVRLYVNGALTATAARTATPWQATGSFVVGRGTAASATPGLWFNGDVSDVRMWDRVAFQNDVDSLSPVNLAGRWTLADTTGYDYLEKHPLTFVASPSTIFDEVHATPALGFDSGLAQYGLASGPVVRTDTSYSVSAWVQPAVVSATAADGYMTAVSQDGTQTSGVQLQYRFDIGTPDTPEWCVTGRSSDASSGSATPPSLTLACARVTSGAIVTTPAVNTWTHLVGVYDANMGTLTLYIDGVVRATVAYTAAWNAAGPAAIGARLNGSAHTDFWHGGLDGVQIFDGALSVAQVDNLYTFGDAFHESS